MSMRSPHRGANLPYRLLAGVVPCPRGWLAATAKLQGITMAPEEPQVFTSFLDVLDYKPSYQVIALFAPVGLLDEASPNGRTCDNQARRLLGMPRASAVASVPPRPALSCATYSEASTASGGHLSAVRWRQMSKIAEVDRAIAPYWQRTVFEVHPELTFFQLNQDRPVRYSKRTQLGMEERRRLLAARVPGVEQRARCQVTSNISAATSRCRRLPMDGWRILSRSCLPCSRRPRMGRDGSEDGNHQIGRNGGSGDYAAPCPAFTRVRSTADHHR